MAGSLIKLDPGNQNDLMLDKFSNRISEPDTIRLVFNTSETVIMFRPKERKINKEELHQPMKGFISQ